jgi:hypothetical protein
MAEHEATQCVLMYVCTLLSIDLELVAISKSVFSEFVKIGLTAVKGTGMSAWRD